MERRIAGVPTEVLESVSSSSSSSGDDDHCFTGFDGYKNLIDSGVDVVLLALPTHFHPIYLKACVEAGKHVFCEKTHAVDVPGVHTVLAAGEVARKKGLSLVSGLAWRYHTGVRETMKRVLDGAIGEIVSIVETCNTKFVQTDLRGEKALRIMKHQAASGIR